MIGMFLGIVLAGSTLSFATILGAGGSTRPYILLSIAFAFLTACLIGKYVIKVSPNTRVLVAGGTAIATLAAMLKTANKYFITVALVRVGCKINLRNMVARGIRPVLLGGCTWLTVAVVTLSYVLFFM